MSNIFDVPAFATNFHDIHLARVSRQPAVMPCMRVCVLLVPSLGVMAVPDRDPRSKLLDELIANIPRDAQNEKIEK